MRAVFSKGFVALAKPRCGSTSLRLMLEPLLDVKNGDIKVNTGGQMPPFHPHITAPYLKHILRERGHDVDALDFIITIRQPVSMLWSYHKFFKPDLKSRYNFAKNWDGDNLMDFERWVCEGTLSPNKLWGEFAPQWTLTSGLATLSLEYRAMDQDHTLQVDRIFRIEEPETLHDWLAEKTGKKVQLPHKNRTDTSPPPAIGQEAMDRIKAMMPYESEAYGL